MPRPSKLPDRGRLPWRLAIEAAACVLWFGACRLNQNGVATSYRVPGPPAVSRPDESGPALAPDGDTAEAPPVDAARTAGDAGIADAAAGESTTDAADPVDRAAGAEPAREAPAATEIAPAQDPAGSCPNRPGLVLCLRFEGAVVDESPHQLQTGPTQVDYADGPSGRAVDLRPNSYITFADNDLFYGPALTIEAWLSPRGLAQPTRIVEHHGQYSLQVLPDGTAMCTGGATVMAPAAVAVGTWTSLTCTYDDVVAIWVNGVRIAAAPRMPFARPAQSRLSVGWGGPPERSFDGRLDNVRLWRELRSPAQICSGALGCR